MADTDAVDVRASFEAFFVANRDPIARTLALTFTDESLGYEAADEAMVRAYRDWDKVRHYANPEGWVFRVGLNWSRSWIRRKITAAHNVPVLTASAVATEPDPADGDPDLEAAMAVLNPDQRVVVVLRFYRDLSVAEIAQTLSIAEGTVKSRLSRALRILARELSDRQEEEL